jgi:hypothetical protein
MQHSTTVAVQPVNVESTAWAWGFESALKGESVYTGYYYFAGRRFAAWERGHKAGQALAERIRAKVLAEVKRTMPGAPADLVGGMADVEQGITYCTPGTDWAVVEEDRIGD